jgi:hypothetical protein
MKKKVLRLIFWLTLVSAASRHDILLGLFLYPLALAFVVLIFLSPFILVFAGWMLWYWLRHHRLPDWLAGVLPRRLRRRTRRRWPRPPHDRDAPTEELSIVGSASAQVPLAGNSAGEAARSHLA